MKLPNGEQAVVPQAKAADYLLSDTHPVGRHKAAFFRSFGFRRENWQELAERLERHAVEHEVAREEPSPFGRRFVVEGIMEMVDGRTALVRSVWFLRREEVTPRFVTAHPLRKRKTRDE